MIGPTVGILAVGTKGLDFTRDVLDDLDVSFVQTYTSAASAEPSIDDFERLLRGTRVSLSTDRNVDSADLASVDLVFAVGWQFMIAPPTPNLVVLHDSLLPRYRGFAPTVAALIEGDQVLGVTAVLPAEEADTGNVLSQSKVCISPPLRISEAFEALRPCYREVALSLCNSWSGSLPAGEPQDDGAATYSLWRDDADYEVDWTSDSQRIVRHIYAVGNPYLGARTTVDGEVVFIGEATAVPDRSFVARSPGKLWRFTDDGLDVVCGDGVVRISGLTDIDGAPMTIRKLRTRFGS